MTVGWKPETLSEIAGQDEIRIGSGRMGGGCNKAWCGFSKIVSRSVAASCADEGVLTRCPPPEFSLSCPLHHQGEYEPEGGQPRRPRHGP